MRSFHGRIIAENELIIAAGGEVRADVRARQAVVSGDFEGEMAVTEDIEITETGQFAGTLFQRAPGLVIARGGRFDGRSVFVEDSWTPSPRVGSRRKEGLRRRRRAGPAFRRSERPPGGK